MTEKLKNFIEAAGEGISLTEDDFRQFDGKELTDTELEQIAGGVKYQETKDENEKKYYNIAIDSHKEILADNRGTDSP